MILDEAQAALADNARRWVEVYAALPGGEAHGFWVITDIRVSAFNAVLFPPIGVHDSEVDEILSAARARSVPQLWTLDATASQLRDALVERGLVDVAVYPGMTCNLSALPIDLTPRDVTFSWVRGKREIADFAAVCDAVYGLPALAALLFSEACVQVSGGEDWVLRNLVAYRNSEPVAIASLVLSRLAAGLYNVATVPRKRGIGLAQEIILHALHEAREQGFSCAVLYSSNAAAPLYRQLGFVETSRVADLRLEVPA